MEEVVKRFGTCAVMGRDPVRTPLQPWEEPGKVCQKLYMDFCETTCGIKWLMVIDAKSNLAEVLRMGSSTVGRTIAKLKEVLSRNGVSEQLVSDNEPPLTSAEFREYCAKNGRY